MNNLSDISILNGEAVEPNDGRIAPLDGSAASGGLATSASATLGAGGSRAAAGRGPLGVDGAPAATAQDALAKQALGPNNERLEDLRPDLVNALRELVLEYRQEGIVARRHEIRRIRQARLFWQGLQYAWWNPQDMTWHLPYESKIYDDSAAVEMPRYQFVTNLYQAFGLSFISVLSQDVPATRFYPQSAQSISDITSARAASEVCDLVEQNNRVQHLLTGVAFYLWTDGKIGGYVRYVADAQRAVQASIQFPPGYYVMWSGQYEYLERASARLKIVIPVTLLIIFLLLYLNFRSITETMIVMLSLPFALVGGLWLMWWLGFNLSVAVAVGFIALAGVAAETGVVMLIYLNHALDEIKARRELEGRALTRSDLYDAIMEGAVERVRPKTMTVVAIMASLLPIMWSTGAGSEIMQRIAVPMIGGMISSTLLTLIVIPAIFGLVRGFRLPPGDSGNLQPPPGVEKTENACVLEPAE